MGLRPLLLATWGCAYLTTAPGATVRVVVLDAGTDESLPCGVHVKDANGKPVQPKGLPFWHDHFVCAGSAELDLAPGTYAYEIDRGPEYVLATGRLAIGQVNPPALTNRLRRLVNPAKEGWWSGDLHVHRRPEEMELLMQAEDLHVAPVITWWNNQDAWRNRPRPVNPLVRFDGDRFYHLMGGEDERAGGALLYFNLNAPLEIMGAQPEYPSPMKFLLAARRHPGTWVDVEKPFWYDTPVWLASGKVDSIGIAHNHMQRGGVHAGEAWGRPRDKERLPDPQGNGFWTQEIYYHALNCGLRLPPSAGSASGVLPNPVGYDRLYVHVEGALSYEQWWEGLRAGRVFVSNGPLLRCRANGQWPGHVFRGAAGETVSLRLELALDSRDPIACIEVIQNGRVAQRVSFSEWKRMGSLSSVKFDRSGWLLVRAMAEVPGTFRFASTGPFYVEVGSPPRFVSKASARFFLDWTRERMGQIKLADPRQQEEVLQPHRQAEKFWLAKLAEANAE